MSTSPGVFPMITCTLSVTLSAPLVVDLNTIWLRGFSGQVALLAADVSPTDTTLTLQAAIMAPLPGATMQQAAMVGSTIKIGNCPMVITAIAGTTLTVSRWATAFPFLSLLPTQPTMTHAAGAPI